MKLAFNTETQKVKDESSSILNLETQAVEETGTSLLDLETQHVEKTLYTAPSPTNGRQPCKMLKCLHKKGHNRQQLLSPSGDLGIGQV